jgi:Anti-sigma-K factor rskA
MPDTSPPSPSESWSELLAGYVLGDLTPAEITLVETYLTAHPDRQAEVSSLLLPLDLLPLTLPENQPPDTLRRQILQIAIAESLEVVTPIGHSRTKSRQIWKPIVAGLELLLLAGLGWNSYRLSHELATVKQDLKTAQIARNQQQSKDDRSIVSLLQQPNNRFVTLKNMQGKTGMGNLIVVPQKLVAVLVLQKIEPLPPGQVYRTWAIMGNEEISCADFLPDAEGKVLIQIPLNRLRTAKKVMITIEQQQAIEAVGAITLEGDI